MSIGAPGFEDIGKLGIAIFGGEFEPTEPAANVAAPPNIVMTDWHAPPGIYSGQHHLLKIAGAKFLRERGERD